jgi:YegS/Rv2252/BmrU family lipid kinase
MKPHRTVDVIINPIAGIRPKSEVPEYVRSVLSDEEFDVRIYFTEYAGHASELAARSAEMGVDTVVAIGGDGTINETARSLIGTRTALGLVPMGSGNGLARHIQIPLEVPRALEVVKEGHREQIDYGVVNGHIFFCTAGVGFDARVSRKFAEAKKRGGLTYVRSIFDLFSKYKPSTYTIYTDDGRIREKAFLIAIGNAAQYGNNAYITPRASMQDGLMDVTLIKPFNLIDAPQMAVQLFTRSLDTNENILTFRSSHLRIIMPQADVVHVDGEPIDMEGVLDVQTHAGGLTVLTPAVPSHNLLEPIQYAVEEIHYSILNNVRGMVNDVKKKMAEKHPAEPK